MASSGDGPVWYSEIESLDDLRTLYEGTSVQIVPVSRGRLTGRLTGVTLPESSLTIARFDGAFRTRGMQSGDVTVGLQTEVRGHVSQWSLDLRPGDVVVLPPGTERDGTAIGQAGLVTVTIEPETFERLVRPGLPDPDIDPLRRPRRYRAPPAVRDLMLREIASLAARLPTVPHAHCGALRLFERDVLLPFLVGIANDVSGQVRQSVDADASLFRRVEDWVDQTGSDGANVPDVCAALGVPPRTLQRAFSRALGVGPSQYLRLRRLAWTRNDLTAFGPADTSVTEVAMGHGFWDLSRYAALYKRVYGERPSETLKAAGKRPSAPQLPLRRPRPLSGKGRFRASQSQGKC
jgi:AraC family ethanolamine operon transcriptional activator